MSENSCQGKTVTWPSEQVFVSCFDIFAPLWFGRQLSVFSTKVDVQVTGGGLACGQPDMLGQIEQARDWQYCKVSPPLAKMEP